MAIEWHCHYDDADKTRPKKKLADHHKPLDAILMDDDMPSQILEYAADAASVAHVESAEHVEIAENAVHVGAVVDTANAAKILVAVAAGEALEGSTETQ